MYSNNSRSIQVLYPDGSLVDVHINSYDVARSLALAGPPLEEPVILLHKGRCLCPHLSIASQFVEDGDLVVLKPMPSPGPSIIYKKNVHPNRKSQRELRTKKRMEEVFQEMLRLSDLQFKPYESNQYGGYVYQQMVDEIPDYSADTQEPPLKSVIKESILSDDPLPIYWNIEQDPEEEANGKKKVRKVRRLPGRRRITAHSSIDE